ncbi:CocE/NonD family hydrolase [Mycolicibacterium hippocampi]|uniref:S15 peptidase family protein n=1 Tax=Mycolicibacterium hippocampi TaxID=659824 RepID=UPI0035114A10
MGPGSYVGRVGGLAVALGIGAAIVAGAGSAAADDGAGSSSGTTSSSSSSTSAGEGSSTRSKSRDTRDDDTDDGGSERDAAEPERDADADDSEDTDVTDVTDDADATDRDRDSEAPVEDAEEPVDEEQPAEAEPAVVDDEPLVADVAPVVVDETPPVTETETETEAAPVEPVEVVTTELSGVTPEEAADDTEAPVAPAMTSLVMSLVAAGRELTAESEAEQVGTSLAVAAAEQYPIPTDVEIIEWTPPLEWLQRIPVLGPLVVTPLVGLAHVIPFVGDVIHPVIGFPIDHRAPAGTPAPRSFLVRSFDGAKIFVNFMPAEGLAAGEQAPTVLSGSGLGLPGSTTLELEVDSFLPNDVIGIGALREAGYNVVTWDPRGEWRSDGRMQLQSPDFEGRDVSHIISYLATLPEVALDAQNDPKLGMVGASYGGGIQLATAAIDHRIDAIVPTIAWNNLTEVLFPDASVRSGWGTLLSAVLVATLSRPNERILPAAIVGILTGQVSQSDLDLLNDRGYDDQIGDITAPTLLIQGTVDTLFTLGQADANALALIEAGTTTKVLWYCGGHGTCLSDFNDGEVVIGRTLDWLNRYVKGQDVDTGAQFEWVDQNGDWFSSDSYPAPESMTSVTAVRTDRRTIAYIPFLGGSGPNPLVITRGLVPALLGLPSATWAFNAVNLQVPDATETTHIVGAPELTLTYSGNGNAEHVYAQIVDDRTGLVLGNHITPIPVELDGQTRTVTIPMEQIAHTLQPGQSVTVQVVTSAFNFLNFYSWGAITVEEMSVRLPTLAAVEAVAAA